MKNNVLSTHFNAKSIVWYAFPTVLMMVFMSTYIIVDGIFVANLVGEDALAAVNLVVPLFNVIMAVSLMLGTGGVAVIGKLMGENQYEKARGFLTTIYILGGGSGLILTLLGYLFSEQIILILGANEVLLPYTRDYFMSIIPLTLGMVFQVFVQTFFVTAGKPGLGFGVCLLGGLTNIILDYIFISPNICDMGIAGAGFATGIGNTVPGIFGLIYFTIHKKGSLYFSKPMWDFKIILQSMYNGSSEMVTSLSIAITTFLFNIMMLKFIGKEGVAAISVILYVQMFQMAVYLGYSMGIAPILSYKYGEKNHKQLVDIIKISFEIIGAISIAIVILSLIFADLAISIFISPESPTFALAKEGFMIYSIAYLFMGLNIFISSMFTAFSNGKVSATLSMCRTLVFTVISLIVFPQFFGIVGIWIAVPVAELLALFVSIYYYKKYKKSYDY